MFKSIHIHTIVLWLSTFLFAGCGESTDDYAFVDRPVWVNLAISVSMTDVSLPVVKTAADASSTVAGNVADSPMPGTRAAEDALPAGNNEKINTLRIVIVRPDGIVEYNRFISLSSAVDSYGDEKFEVLGNEKKRIYLFVNEGTEIKTAEGTMRKVVDYDLAAIKEGERFPAADISGLRIRLEDNTEQLAGPLPMSECHDITVGGTDSRHELFVTRAAVKFSFNITNNSGRNIVLKGLTIARMAKEEYYLPKNTIYNDVVIDGVDCKEITSYDVPSDAGYYEYGSDKGLSETLSAGSKVSLSPIYLLEGKYTAVDDERNYSMKIFFDGMELGDWFPKLSRLPRNTHVVVNITIGKTAVDWDVDVLPYIPVDLDPEFGL